jgi:hypothetical protein
MVLTFFDFHLKIYNLGKGSQDVKSLGFCVIGDLVKSLLNRESCLWWYWLLPKSKLNLRIRGSSWRNAVS